MVALQDLWIFSIKILQSNIFADLAVFDYCSIIGCIVIYESIAVCITWECAVQQQQQILIEGKQQAEARPIL